MKPMFVCDCVYIKDSVKSIALMVIKFRTKWTDNLTSEDVHTDAIILNLAF